MTEPHTEVEVERIPPCDIHGCSEPAYADALLVALRGPWGYVCKAHFDEYGCSLGLGLGQRLIQREE